MQGNFGGRETSLSPESQGGGAARQKAAEKNIIVLKWLRLKTRRGTRMKC